MTPLVDIIIKIDNHSQTQKSKLWENHNSDCGNIWHVLTPIGAPDGISSKVLYALYKLVICKLQVNAALMDID